MYIFFALTDDNENRIQRIRLHRKPQEELSKEFDCQRKAFEDMAKAIAFEISYKRGQGCDVRFDGTNRTSQPWPLSPNRVRKRPRGSKLA